MCFGNKVRGDTLRIVRAEMHDRGVYICSASNANGQAQSSAVVDIERQLVLFFACQHCYNNSTGNTAMKISSTLVYDDTLYDINNNIGMMNVVAVFPVEIGCSATFFLDEFAQLLLRPMQRL